LAALIKSAKPTLTNREIRDLILNNTDNIDLQNPNFAGKLGNGLINPVKIFQSLKVPAIAGNLIKGSSKAVYYYGIDNKRYVFPDEQTYFSWYDDYKQVNVISDSALAQIPIGGNVTMRPGVRMVKIISSPQVYAVSQGAVLHWLKTEEVAQSLYGTNWQNMIVDISDAFFINYQIGEPVEKNIDFNPFLEKNNVVSIDLDKGLK
jgi:hypothetical protein